MALLSDWANAPAIILSCPGPLRRYQAALLEIEDVRMPQMLLGSGAQLLAFAAAAGDLAPRLRFAPVPELFAGPERLAEACGLPGDMRRAVHLRFGGIRAARVLKGVRNAAIIAESAMPLPLTASHHPFAAGTVLPAAIERLYGYGPDMAHPRAITGADLPAFLLPETCRLADLPPATARLPAAPERAGLDLVRLDEFQAEDWAARPLVSRAGAARLALAGPAHDTSGGGGVCLPWNLDHPGSIVPILLERLVRLRDSAEGQPDIFLLPFNYVGLTGIIREMIARLGNAAADRGLALSHIYMARVQRRAAVPLLRALAPVAWIDGNDPEHWFTRIRLEACGIVTILLDPEGAPAGSAAGGDAPPRLAADEALWIEADTRCGALTFPARLPSWHALRDLLRLSVRHQPVPAPASGARPRRSARVVRA